MFVSSGGKNRVAVVVKALKSIGVEVKAVLDFDVLNDKSVMTNIMTALGGEWSESIAEDFNLVKRSVESKRPELNKTNVLQQIENIFGEVESEIVPRQAVNKIQGILRRSSPWSASKEVGENIIPSGDASKAWLRLHKYCQEIGFHVIETGELESFVKSIGGHSQAWVNEVLKLDLATDERLSKAREFVSRLFPQ